MDERFNKQFKMESSELNRLRLSNIEIQELYDHERYDGKNQIDLKAIQRKLLEAKKREEEYRDIYAEKVFDLFQKINPILIRRRDKIEVEWIEAFGTDFFQISPELKASIVALVEEDGGQYRLK